MWKTIAKVLSLIWLLSFPAKGDESGLSMKEFRQAGFDSFIQMPPCPKNRMEWLKAKEAAIDNMIDSPRPTWNPEAVKFYQSVEVCKDSYNRFVTPEDQVCFERVTRFSQLAIPTSEQKKASRQLRFKLPDAKYDSEGPPEILPEAMKLPAYFKDEEFLRKVKDPANADELASLLETKLSDPPRTKAVAFKFKSQFLKAIDGTESFQRIFVAIRGPRFDQWIQITLPDPSLPERKAEPHQLSLVTTQKTDAGGKKLKRPRVFFKDWWRYNYEGHEHVGTRYQAGQGGENCYNCHKSGVNPLLPAPGGYDRAQFGDRLEEVNGWAEHYGAPDFPGAVDPEDFGPPLGAVDPKGRAKLLESCLDTPPVTTADKARIRTDKLRKAMNCSSCHNGVKQGILNFPLGAPGNGPDGILAAWVSQGKMPPHMPELNASERTALVACLGMEYYGDVLKGTRGTLQTWLNEKCSPAQTPTAIQGGVGAVDGR